MGLASPGEYQQRRGSPGHDVSFTGKNSEQGTARMHTGPSLRSKGSCCSGDLLLGFQAPGQVYASTGEPRNIEETSGEPNRSAAECGYELQRQSRIDRSRSDDHELFPTNWIHLQSPRITDGRICIGGGNLTVIHDISASLRKQSEALLDVNPGVIASLNASCPGRSAKQIPTYTFLGWLWEIQVSPAGSRGVKCVNTERKGEHQVELCVGVLQAHFPHSMGLD